MADSGGMTKYWALGLLVVFVIHGTLCYFLFSAQANKIEEVIEKSDYISSFVGERIVIIHEGAERFEEVVELVHRASDMFADMVVVKTGQPGDEMMVAVSKSSSLFDVNLLDIVPIPAPDDTLFVSDNWKIRVSGGYSDIIRFIGKLERQGVMIDAGNFSLRIAREGVLELTAVIKICTLERLERAAEAKGVKVGSKTEALLNRTSTAQPR